MKWLFALFLVLLTPLIVQAGKVGDPCDYYTYNDSQCDPANNIVCDALNYKCVYFAGNSCSKPSEDPFSKGTMESRYRDQYGYVYNNNYIDQCIKTFKPDDTNSYTLSDCTGGDDKCFVLEYACNTDNTPNTNNFIKCQYGCKDGACIATCYDGVKNQDETDADCGGPCSPCSEGDRCLTSIDCLSGLCENNICVQKETCSDKIKNQDETDADCGGVCVSTCRKGQSCISGSDCFSGNCIEGVCSDIQGNPSHIDNQLLLLYIERWSKTVSGESVDEEVPDERMLVLIGIWRDSIG